MKTSSDHVASGEPIAAEGTAPAAMIRYATFLGLALLGFPAGGKAGATDLPAAPTTQPAAIDRQKSSGGDFTWFSFPDDTRFKTLGLYWLGENRPNLWRMPQGRFGELPSGVKRRCRTPSGGRILIECNTTKLALRVTPVSKGSLKGFDVYINGRFLSSAVAEEPNTTRELALFKELDHKKKEILIYLPHHQEVVIESVGVDKDTKFSPPEHKFARPLPVVFYGSSVCQGTGASKPGMTYAAIACRELNLDFFNLGFGGAGKAEPRVVDLVNSIPTCCYVLDLGKSYGMQDRTAYQEMLQTLRNSHPDVPIICITPITSSVEIYSEEYSRRSIHTRAVMRGAVHELIHSGTRKLYLLEGEDLLGFDEHDGLSKDGVHPSDYGFSIIARKLAPVLKQAVGL